MYLIALPTLSQRRLNFDFLSTVRTILQCLEDYTFSILLIAHRQLIEERGLRETLEVCSLATIGVGAVVDVNQIKRARYCIQDSLCSLYRTLVDAVKTDSSTLDHGSG